MDITGTGNGENITGTDDAEVINAGDGDDTVNGLGGNDVLNGEGGNDTLHGDGGNDVLNGGTGADTMFGGAGDDIYYFDYNWDGTVTDNVIEQAGEGTDEVRTSVGLGIEWLANVENLTAIGTGHIFLGGNSLDNVITGNSGDNYINAVGGNDTIDGGAGRDSSSYQLPEGTTGTIRQVAGAGADEGYILIQLVNGEDVQTWARVSVSGVGAATVEGIGIGAFLGTDTVTSVEELHFLITNTADYQTQFTNVQLAANQYGDGVGGGEAGETIDLNDFPGATGASGNGGEEPNFGTAVYNYVIGGAG